MVQLLIIMMRITIMAKTIQFEYYQNTAVHCGSWNRQNLVQIQLIKYIINQGIHFIGKVLYQVTQSLIISIP